MIFAAQSHIHTVHFWTSSALPEFSDSDDDNIGAIVGAVVGGIMGMILITLSLLMILWCYYKQYKKKTESGMFTCVCVHMYIGT